MIVQEYEDDNKINEREIQQKRDYDEWSDENPRGSGNTGTKGYYYGKKENKREN